MALDQTTRTFFEKSRSLVENAALLAICAHAEQKRKDDGSPYITHPIMVALKLASHGCSETIIAAGYVHDVLEDTAVTQEELEHFVGEEVVRIVLTLTEDKSLPWEERKKNYIESIRLAPESSKFVCVADKIHNLESLFASFELQGDRVWKYFTKGKEEQVWYHKTMLHTLQKSWSHPLVNEYAALVDRLARL